MLVSAHFLSEVTKGPWEAAFWQQETLTWQQESRAGQGFPPRKERKSCERRGHAGLTFSCWEMFWGGVELAERCRSACMVNGTWKHLHTLTTAHRCVPSNVGSVWAGACKVAKAFLSCSLGWVRWEPHTPFSRATVIMTSSRSSLFPLLLGAAFTFPKAAGTPPAAVYFWEREASEIERTSRGPGK